MIFDNIFIFLKIKLVSCFSKTKFLSVSIPYPNYITCNLLSAFIFRAGIKMLILDLACGLEQINMLYVYQIVRISINSWK